MANVDLQQIRAARPAVLPLDTDQTLVELQQENLDAGEKSTVATLKEIQSSPLSSVTIASGTHTTGLECLIRVTAATCAISIDNASWAIDARKEIRKLSAYDGNAVTITPPDGATIEGLASLELFGQYSFVELERISETVFAIRDLRDYFQNADGECVARGDGTLEQWGRKQPTGGTFPRTIMYQFPRAIYSVGAFSGTAVPFNTYETFMAYASINYFTIYTQIEGNAYDWHWIGRWR